jgi:hypothetical protein
VVEATWAYQGVVACQEAEKVVASWVAFLVVACLEVLGLRAVAVACQAALLQGVLVAQVGVVEVLADL